MKYKVVPFTARITRDDTSATVALQMQALIDSTVTNGWEYMRMDTVQTSVAGTKGCFGFGAQPPFSTTFSVLVFRKV